MISSVSLSRSGWMRATQSLQVIQLPKADNFSSTRTTLTVSGSELRMCLSSLSVVLLGTSNPFLLPAVVLPTILVPPTVVWMTGMNEPSQLSKTLQKLQEPPAATRQYPFVNFAKTPISLEFQYCTLLAIVMIIINQQKNNNKYAPLCSLHYPPCISTIFNDFADCIIFIMTTGRQMQQCLPLLQKKQHLVDRYFVGQHEFDHQFVRIVFELEADPQIQQLITQHANRILMSKQTAAIYFLQQLLQIEKYQHLAQAFLLGLVELKIRIHNQALLLYILRTLPELLVFLNRNTQEFIHAIITFLSLNMRSFHRQVKLTATQTLKDLVLVVGKQKGEWEKVMKRVVPMMVEKEQLVKEVSYIKGLFLQMLEDELHQVRILTIHCLGIYRNYLKPQDLKQIIIYMLNDQHELVREEALQTAKSLKDMPLGKEDLSTLLMCLREKRTNLRRLVYENLSLVRINDISLVPLLLQKTLLALQNYRSDKKHIYRALYEIGRKYYLQIGKIFSNLNLNQVQQPNCKNISYKAKMVLCHVWWKKKAFTNDNIRLPSYFVKHMLYISDVQAYLFETPSNFQEQTESSVDSQQLKSNFHHLVRFIECQEDISQEFHKTLLEVAREMVVGHSQKEVLIQKLANLSISFNLGKEEQDIKTRLQTLIQQQCKDIDAIISLVMACIENREAFELKNSFVANNKCTVSRLEPNLIVSSKCQQFIERVYLKCWKHTLINKDRKIQYKRLSELQRLTQSQPSYFWRANLSKYNKIQIVLLSYENEQKVLDSFQLQQK